MPVNMIADTLKTSATIYHEWLRYAAITHLHESKCHHVGSIVKATADAGVTTFLNEFACVLANTRVEKDHFATGELTGDGVITCDFVAGRRYSIDSRDLVS